MKKNSQKCPQALLINSGKAFALQRVIFTWFDDHGRHAIPWKLKADGCRPASGEIIGAYGVWIAEIMLQQTQLKTVLPYWHKWMDVFPGLIELASADEQTVLLLWQGLGYYSRARRIHKASKILLDLIGAKESGDPNAWPRDLDTWMALPGIGRTTAGSIISSAFDLPEAILDGNVQRLLARLFACNSEPKKNLSDLWTLIEQLLDHERPRDFNQAIMDLGAKICIPKNPLCSKCPLRRHCFAYASGQQKMLPMKDVKKKLPFHVIGIGVVVNESGQVLIAQRLAEGLLGGLWEFPGGKQEEGEVIELTISRELKEELDIDVEVDEKLVSFEHAYSHMKLRFEVFLCRHIDGEPKPLSSQKVKWVTLSALSEYPFPAANARMIASLRDHLNYDKKARAEYFQDI
ncbi:A/G-specific adenine glycosylase [Prochlorococcus sp. MIT 1300]|uniref:A/G-specific adenine glycosylase n=1 Tax=Prochlorococcus sp. MIT 1300 TaxID=3096218 RepID=UPI002A75DE4C|nr:A/G-specific adenine glycosylase [Prochlorococcus sp. MIT 1300]